MPKMTSLMRLFLVLAAIGSVAVLAIHVAALLGSTWPFEHYMRFIIPGMFVVFLPAILAMNRLTRDFKQKDLWRAALRGCPPWMTRTFYIVFGYVWIAFLVLPFFYGGGMDLPADKARSMSAVILVFYLMPAVVLYSALQVETSDQGRRCLNGHHISPLAKYCEECGASAVEQSPANDRSS